MGVERTNLSVAAKSLERGQTGQLPAPTQSPPHPTAVPRAASARGMHRNANAGRVAPATPATPAVEADKFNAETPSSASAKDPGAPPIEATTARKAQEQARQGDGLYGIPHQEPVAEPAPAAPAAEDHLDAFLTEAGKLWSKETRGDVHIGAMLHSLVALAAQLAFDPKVGELAPQSSTLGQYAWIAKTLAEEHKIDAGKIVSLVDRSVAFAGGLKASGAPDPVSDDQGAHAKKLRDEGRSLLTDLSGLAIGFLMARKKAQIARPLPPQAQAPAPSPSQPAASGKAEPVKKSEPAKPAQKVDYTHLERNAHPLHVTSRALTAKMNAKHFGSEGLAFTYYDKATKKDVTLRAEDGVRLGELLALDPDTKVRVSLDVGARKPTQEMQRLYGSKYQPALSTHFETVLDKVSLRDVLSGSVNLDARATAVMNAKFKPRA